MGNLKKTKIRNSGLLLITAFIWGIAFVAQLSGGNAVGPFTFNAIRSLLGCVALIPVLLVLDKMGVTRGTPKNSQEKKTLIVGGILCGLALCLASNVQQVGLLLGQSAGKAGFLTTLYILLVPILGIFLKRKCRWNVWVGVVIAIVGMYLLCFKGNLSSFKLGDGLLLLTSLLFSFHILIIDYYTPKVDGVRMSIIQLLVCGTVTLIPMYFYDINVHFGSFAKWAEPLTRFESWIPILYAGILSSGVAYTLQIIGQNKINPTVASLIMSLESVFSVIAGWVILGDKLSPRELLGCGLIFTAVCIAQLRLNIKKRTS
ncbi:MAG: DMT family transporter [Eubacterium sp.]|nr:DMT family transporter [Eubacterium sp.]